MMLKKLSRWCGAAAVSLLAALSFSTPASAAGGPFATCPVEMYVAQSGGSAGFALYRVDTSKNPFTFPLVGKPAAGLNYNAIGFNKLDGYMYGIINSGHNLARIASDGSVTNMGPIAGFDPTAAQNYNSADVTDDGLMYVKPVVTGGVQNALWVIDLKQLAPGVPIVATQVPMTAAFGVADLAWVKQGTAKGLLYGVTGQASQLVSIDLNSSPAQVNFIGSPYNDGDQVGAMIGASNGVFGAANSGVFYQYDVATGVRTVISSSPPSTGNDGAHCTTADVVLSTDLAITKTDGVPSYRPGTDITYDVVVTNNGPFGVQNADVDDPLPAGTTAGGWTCTAANGGVCVTGSGTGALSHAKVNLPLNASATFKVKLTVPATFTGNLVNTATITTPPGFIDSNPANNTATDTDAPPPQVTIRKISVGGVGAFSFSGDNGVAAQTLTTTTPGTAVAGTPSLLTTVGGATTITEAVSPGYALTDISCTGMATGGSAAPDPANRKVTLDAAATALGSNIVCTFTNARQPTLRLAKALPSGRFVAADQFALSIAGTGGPVTATTTGSSNTPSESAVLVNATAGSPYTLSEAATGGADLANYASTWACTNALAGGQAPSGNGASFSVTPVIGDDLNCTITNVPGPKADLAIVKAASPANAQAGDIVTYTLTGSNNGPGAANGAVIRDVPGAGLSCPAPSTPVTCTASGGAACPSATVPASSLLGAGGVTIPIFPAGGQVVITMQCQVTASGAP
ncbi:hypothetical protein WKW79_12205 [Variovorax robiniae]|uniref:DUF11 domain-containing protein n=1 Tax=Variovorax robiniae TaxID=1836199 RepID=A0ABU8X6R1_9BURK